MSFDSRDPGTSNDEWLQDPRLAQLPIATLADRDRVVVLAAHPDDETLGVGGLVARAARAGARVTVVVVTDGAASDPALAHRRTAEAESAVAELGAGAPVRLGHADGRVREDRGPIAGEVTRIVEAELEAGTAPPLLVAPWRGDGHRDHRVLGEIAREVAGSLGLALWEYPIWLWHWARPDHAAVPWQQLHRLPLTPAELDLKQRALASYPSQTTGEPPLLHARFLANFARPFEVVIAEAPSSGPSPGLRGGLVGPDGGASQVGR